MALHLTILKSINNDIAHFIITWYLFKFSKQFPVRDVIKCLWEVQS